MFSMSNSNREDVVTLLWEIENFNELFTHKIESPVFLSHSLDRTRWKMCLYTDWYDHNNDDYISLSFTRCGSGDTEVEKIVLDGELSIVDEYGESSLVSQQLKNHVFVKDHSWSPCKAFVSRNDVFFKRRADFIPDNLLQVRCRIWRSFNITTLSELIIYHTKIERSHFTWKIENFSCIKDHEVKEMHVKKHSSESPILSYRFYTDEIFDKAIIEMISNSSFNMSIWCEITALNSTGERFNSESYNFTSNDENLYERCLTLILSDLLNNKTLYLPMDALSLRVECFYWISDINVSRITIPNTHVFESFQSVEKSDSKGRAENVMPTETNDKQSMTKSIPSSPKCHQQSMIETDNSKVFHFNPGKSCEREKSYINSDTYLELFAQDMHFMYEEGLLSDFTLCAGNKTFPVHKSILSARSPAFKAMFTTPLKKKEAEVLDIPDIGADTLHRMLVFVYTSEIAHLEWEDAISLFFALTSTTLRT
ncbi:hypothetical protein JTE90_029622 [Oedothorax gibbosus]|uniref:Uncharacterized protein n=1 Tax=Oedothorax gibbosus TaxID=931172 RepID=A0AAV6VEC5_9ARAC|nr:hypothetical protein JTE90_029622 [Oedothorax gibbosus]